MSWTASKLSPVRRKERIEFLEEKIKKEFLLNGTNAMSELESLYRKLSVSRQGFKIILRLHSPGFFFFLSPCISTSLSLRETLNSSELHPPFLQCLDIFRKKCLKT